MPPTPACHRLCEALVDLAFSGQSPEVVMEQATLLLRSGVRAAGPADGFRGVLREGGAPDGFAAEAAASGGPAPASFSAGREVGRALGQAIRGQLDRPMLRTRLRALLCE